MRTPCQVSPNRSWAEERQPRHYADARITDADNMVFIVRCVRRQSPVSPGRHVFLRLLGVAAGSLDVRQPYRHPQRNRRKP